ncbi:glycosyltransferase family 2 protein [Flavobacterium selenitireducens]|uniref:glycosyltransferase family 2 protein n=1 Tax=Flavobacterium selenitireducens TaxID=2722704 RepID=UPI00168B7E6E|nr:glycosyltransferase family A protein [Flavobacterium selenitireducens]MBD3583456.1 glycosyltransferase family 2 protein [Flavobacterium selenitireducens]
MQKLLTVFTPTFNRAYCLGQVYESLVRQTRQDFVWMVIDDGSTDETKALVEGWISENKIEIRYIHQENQGMHGGHNTAYANITTELNTCIDSDDFMLDDAVEKILAHWEKHGLDAPNLAGIVALDAYRDGKVIGKKIPDHLKTCKLSELYQKHNVSGDKKLILRTEIARQFPPYPIFEGEKFVPLGILYLMIDQQYDLLPLNEVVCIVEYLPDGSSRNIFKQYRRHPKGFAYSRTIAMKYGVTFRQKFRNAIHFVANNIQLKRISFLFKNPNVPLTLLALPFGVAVYFYIRSKARN